jgi:peptidoglycan/LPS O-acetylase OafA/YrhL
MGILALAPPEAFPVFLFSEGHTGVALFMTLSGYLFAKLLDGKQILYSSFLWNRFLRLVPLLASVIILSGIKRYLSGGNMAAYATLIVSGIAEPTLPNGGWSITVESHFYLLLPVLLFLSRRWEYFLVCVLLAANALRVLLHMHFGQIQVLSYYTIVGRIDQFVLGILAFGLRQRIAGRHVQVLSLFAAFLGCYWYFDQQGGFYMSPSYPSSSKIWIYLPTIEGATYAMGAIC